MKKLNLFLMLVILGFGMMDAQTAEGAADNAAVVKAPCEGTTADSGVPIDGGNCGIAAAWNGRIAIAPYAQVVAGNSYSFIGVSHPSLATAHTSIGVVVEALNMTTVPNNATGRAAVFTVSAGQTHRVFIVNQTHPTINLNNSNFTDSQTHLITTSDGAQFGNVKVWSVGTEPNYATLTTHRPGRYHHRAGNAAGTILYRHDNLNQLALWGVVYQTSNGAGFAMEFVGDMHDSAVSGSGLVNRAYGIEILQENSSGAGRGIN